MKNLFLLFLYLPLLIGLPGCQNSPEEKAVPIPYLVSDQLSHQQVTAFAEDRLGYLWIGTKYGLNCYNGYNYRQYYYNGNSTDICDNQIMGLYKDSRQRLWIGTKNGICVRTDTDTYQSVPVKTGDSFIYQIMENQKGRILINVRSTFLCVYDEKEHAFIPCIDFDLGDFPNKCYMDKANRIWMVSPNSLKCYDGSTFALLQSIPLKKSPHDSNLQANGELWLFTEKEIQIFDTKTGMFISTPGALYKHDKLAYAIKTAVYSCDDTWLLINTLRDGLFVYNKQSEEVIHQDEGKFPFEMPLLEITSFFTDSQKNLWIGSYDQGFMARYNYKRRFNSDYLLHSKFEGKSVTAMSIDKEERFWIATRMNGVSVYDLRTNQLNTMNLHGFSPLDEGFNENMIDIVFVDSRNDIWLSSNGRLFRCRYINNVLLCQAAFRFKNGVNCITEDSNGTIWIGGYSGTLHILQEGQSAFAEFNIFKSGLNIIYCMATLKNGEIIVGMSNKNLQIIDPATRRIREIEILSQTKDDKFTPTTLFEDSQGNIWIGTAGSGLYVYHTQARHLERMTGIACEEICSVQEDAHGHFWIGTFNGLFKYDISVKQFSTYYASDGIGGNQFNKKSSLAVSSQALLFGGTHGITFFTPMDVIPTNALPLYFEELKVNNRLVLPDSANSPIKETMSADPQVTLRYNQNSISIAYSALKYGDYSRIRYEYMMQGYDKRWVEAGNIRQANYSNLPAGKYQFRVRTSEGDYANAVVEKVIPVTVLSAPWLTWPFLILYVCIVLLSVWYILSLYIKLKTNKAKVQLAILEKEQEKLNNERNMRFFANISHEFRTPLTTISGPVTMLIDHPETCSESKKLLQIVNRSVDRMLRLVNQLMQFNLIEYDALKLKLAPLAVNEALKKLSEVFTLLATERGINFRTKGFDTTWHSMIDEDKLEKIVSNILSNALKYTPKGGDIEIEFKLIISQEAGDLFNTILQDSPQQWIYISVSDSGPGIPDEHLEEIFHRYYRLDYATNYSGTGIGLYFSRRLVELHGGFIRAMRRSETGSTFVFVLPHIEVPDERIERTQENLIADNDDSSNPISAESREKQQDITLLLVDDDPDMLHYLFAILSPHYHIITCSDGKEAFNAIEMSMPDLIISDIVMPVLNGLDLLELIRRNLTYNHLPVILLTARTTLNDQVEGLHKGANAYIVKPFYPDYLLAVIKSQLQYRQQYRRILEQTTSPTEEMFSELQPQNSLFLKAFYQLMEDELANPELNITHITERMHMSRTKLYYKIKGLTGTNPIILFKTYRLNRAAELLLNSSFNISEIADRTGFGTLSHFSASFKKQFNMSPSEYRGEK